jgi:4-hydroxy-tetrahydrodipicolinate synthase
MTAAPLPIRGTAPLPIRGTWTALITPFSDSGEVDFDALDRLVDDQIAGGVSALVPCGTTGESPTLSHDEHDAVVARTVTRTAGRVPVVAGAGSNSTREAARLVKSAADSGADGVLVVCPYYNRPSDRMLFAHFAALAEESPLPIVLYNVPGRTGVNLLPATVARLSAEFETVVAVKEAAGSVDQVAQIRDLSDIGILSGDDALTLPMTTVGATGVISVASNVIPARVSALVEAALSGEHEVAARSNAELLPLFRALFCEPNPVPVKAALALLGKGNGRVRRPLLAALPETSERLRPLLSELGVLPNC